MAFSNSDLSVKLYFDLDNDRFRIQDVSDYTGATPAIAEANIRGVYTLTDPNINVLHVNADYDNPDVATSIDADLYSAYKSFTAANGDYTLVYSVKDVNTSTEYTKTFTYTYASTNTPDITIGIESNVGLATIESTDETAYTYTGATITKSSRTHTLTYPAAWGSTTQTSTTIDSISLTELYTGQYSATITTAIVMTQTDNLIISESITGTQTHDVWDSDGMYAVRAALNTFYDRWQTAQTADPKEGRRLQYLWVEINANYALYNSYKQNGDIDNAGEYLDNIKTILSAESIDTTIDPSVSVPVIASLPGYATRWLQDTEAPSASTGRNGDYYINTTTNQYYLKESGSWSLVGTLGANTVIEFSDTGGSASSSWSGTYSDGANYIRLSGDGGATYTEPAKFIDGYTYIAYASDASGTDFICTDDPAFSFDSSLEYRAEKKFQSSHNGDLVAGDFSGLFVRYKGEGISASVSNIEVPYDPNTTTYDYTNAKAQIILRRGGEDLTTDFAYAKGTESNVTATVGAGTGLVTITNMTSTSGYVDVTASKSGVSNITIRVYVSRVDFGENSIIAFCSTPSISIPTDADGNNPVFPTGLTNRPRIYVYDADTDVTANWTFSIDETVNVTATVVDSNEVSITDISADFGTILINATRSGYDDLQVLIIVHKTKAGQAIVDATSVDDVTIGLNGSDKLYIKDESLGITKLNNSGSSFINVGDNLTISSITDPYIDALSDNTIAFIDEAVSELTTYRYDGKGWRKEGSGLSISAGFNHMLSTLDFSNNIAFCENRRYLSKYNFNGSTWSKVGNTLDLGVGVQNDGIATLTSSRIALADSSSGFITAYDFDGTDWSSVGSSYSGSINGDDLCGLNSTSIAVFGSEGSGLSKFTFNGSTWSKVGNTLAITIGNGSVKSIDESSVLLVNDQIDEIRKYTFDGSDWSEYGNPVIVSGTSRPTIAVMGNYLVYLDDDTEKLTNFVKCNIFGL